MAIGVLIEALLGGSTVSTTKSGNSSDGDGKGGGRAREWIKNKLKVVSWLLGKLADKALAALLGIIGSIISWILNMQSKRSDWLVILEFVGTYNGCWCFDIHVYDHKSEKEINHLNIHHTVKTAVIANIKAAFSCS